MSSCPEPYDAVVVGGGVVGLATALAVADGGRRVALVERDPPRRVRGALGSDLRTVALTPASVGFLRSLGANLDGALAPINAMRVWEHDGGGMLRFDSADVRPRPTPLAWVAENSAVATTLWALTRGRVTSVSGRLAALSQEPDQIRLELDGGEALAARLVIGADGPESAVRTLTGAALRRRSPPARKRQRAIATIARLAKPHRGTAWQRFGETGPVALLPLAEERTVSVIWSGSAAEQEARLALDDAGFLAALRAATENAGGGAIAVDERLSFPVGQALADFNPWPRVVLAGDAARILHPLAGQGVNLGLEDARHVAALATAEGDAFGDPRWRGYAQARRRRAKTMLGASWGLLAAYSDDGLAAAFQATWPRGRHRQPAGDGTASQGPWLRWARNTVIRGIDAAPAVKAQLVREAMGVGPLAQ